MLDNLGQNSWSEHLSCSGVSLILVLNQNPYHVFPRDTRAHEMPQGLLLHVPHLKVIRKKLNTHLLYQTRHIIAFVHTNRNSFTELGYLCFYFIQFL